MRSGAVSALYRSLVLKCGPGKGNPTSPKKRFGAQANAHLERLVGELASRSHHARRVAEHAVQFRKRVEYMAKWVSCWAHGSGEQAAHLGSPVVWS